MFVWFPRQPRNPSTRRNPAMPSTTYSITTRIPSDESGPLLALKVTHSLDVVRATDVPLALASFPQRFVVTHGGHVEISLQGRHQNLIPVDVLSKSGGLLEFVRALTEVRRKGEIHIAALRVLTFSC